MYKLKMTSAGSALTCLAIELTDDYSTALVGALLIGKELSAQGMSRSFRLYRDGVPLVYLQFHDGELYSLHEGHYDYDFDDELEDIESDD